ncbi:LacI family DNA-binding transcriptional regulator [Sinomonas sp. ASV322]|uniref:LacI family DNA-binding transcriptional regulator n=1 Tax=Sinomonas sp. ASV322 TaxID=3041920 RepID=UPI0027DCEAA4|nr:LacI family DNA-binding transcriptional regulator [Sinomonas sp. ASV322]MDQ4503112.1 LacI family DNA-binding transcriptional regulator [Sinomonas sp. ASV322]
MGRAGSKAATIVDVAVLAGVSKSAASLALRGTGYVSEVKRRAVLDAAAELGYRPNAAARAMGAQRSGIVGLILDDLRNPWFVPAVEGLSAGLHGEGLRPLLGDWRLEGAPLVERFLELRVEGIVLVGTLDGAEPALIGVAPVPVVQVGSPRAQAPGAAVVTNDDAEGARRVVRHLAALGHRNIAHLGAPGTAVGDARRAGFEEEARRLGLAHRTVAAGLTEDAGYRAGLALLEAPDRPTAVFAVNDMAALGAFSAAEELGLSVPDDVSLAGYDDTPTARLRTVGLTSVDNASGEAGRVAAGLLAKAIAAGPESVTDAVLLEPELKARGSTAPPPAVVR